MYKRAYSATLVLSVVFLFLSAGITIANPSILEFDRNNYLLDNILKILEFQKIKIFLETITAYFYFFIMRCAMDLDRHVGLKTIFSVSIITIAMQHIHMFTEINTTFIGFSFMILSVRLNPQKIIRLFVFMVTLNVYHRFMFFIHSVLVLDVYQNTMYIATLGLQSFFIQIVIVVIMFRAKERMTWDIRLLALHMESMLRKSAKTLKEQKRKFKNDMQKEFLFYKKCMTKMPKIMLHYIAPLPKFKNMKFLKERKDKTSPIELLEICEIENEIVVRSKIAATSILTISTCITCGVLFDKEIEMLYFFVSHAVIRPRMPMELHYKKTKVCAFVTSLVMYIGCVLSFDVNISIYGSIPVAFLICYVGSKMASEIDLRLYKEAQESFSLDTCTELELILKCQRKGFSEDDVKNAVICFAKRYTGKQLAEFWHTDVDSARHKKMKLKKRINS